MSDESVIESVEESLEKLVAQAVEIRFAAKPIPSPSENVSFQLDVLRDVRGLLDQLDEILVRVMRVRARARRSSFTAAYEAEAKWDQELDSILRAPAQRGGEFVGAKERASEANLRSLSERRSAFIARRGADTADAAAEVIKKLHRDLDSIRQDIGLIVRSRAFESSLDR